MEDQHVTVWLLYISLWLLLQRSNAFEFQSGCIRSYLWPLLLELDSEDPQETNSERHQRRHLLVWRRGTSRCLRWRALPAKSGFKDLHACYWHYRQKCEVMQYAQYSELFSLFRLLSHSTDTQSPLELLKTRDSTCVMSGAPRQSLRWTPERVCLYPGQTTFTSWTETG